MLKKNDKIYCPFKMCISFRKLFRAIAFYYTRESENLLEGLENFDERTSLFSMSKKIKNIYLMVINIVLTYSEYIRG